MTADRYPPRHHLVTDRDAVLETLAALEFATLISADGEQVQATQLPLVLDRKRGDSGVLVGHMDKRNPHTALLDGRRALAQFTGPHAYISPTVYTTTQLPTWNYITVHARGGVTLMADQDAVHESLRVMTRRLEGDTAVLARAERKLHALLPHIVGFELHIDELLGRFKLSQDKNATDRQCAKEHLKAVARRGYDELIERLS